MKSINKRKEWKKEEIVEIYNTPKERYGELAKKFGRTVGSIMVKNRTKEELLKISSYIRPNISKPDRWMIELFIEGKKPKM